MARRDAAGLAKTGCFLPKNTHTKTSNSIIVKRALLMTCIYPQTILNQMSSVHMFGYANAVLSLTMLSEHGTAEKKENHDFNSKKSLWQATY